MTTEEILQGNKLIAEFMGAKYDKDTSFCMHPNDLWLPIHGVVNYKTTESGSGKTLHYHSSWDWLMPVVEKIESMLHDDIVITIEYKDCLIPVVAGTFKTDNDGFDIHIKGAESKINAVYQAVIEFITWYNKQK